MIMTRDMPASVGLRSGVLVGPLSRAENGCIEITILIAIAGFAAKTRGLGKAAR